MVEADLFCGPGARRDFDHRGRKVVGISQRRTRSWARFQCALSLRWEPSVFVDLISGGPEVADIEHMGFDAGADLDVERLRDSFTEALERALSLGVPSDPPVGDS